MNRFTYSSLIRAGSKGGCLEWHASKNRRGKILNKKNVQSAIAPESVDCVQASLSCSPGHGQTSGWTGVQAAGWKGVGDGVCAFWSCYGWKAKNDWVSASNLDSSLKCTTGLVHKLCFEEEECASSCGDYGGGQGAQGEDSLHYPCRTFLHTRQWSFWFWFCKYAWHKRSPLSSTNTNRTQPEMTCFDVTPRSHGPRPQLFWKNKTAGQIPQTR